MSWSPGPSFQEESSFHVTRHGSMHSRTKPSLGPRTLVDTAAVSALGESGPRTHRAPKPSLGSQSCRSPGPSHRVPAAAPKAGPAHLRPC